MKMALDLVCTFERPFFFEKTDLSEKVCVCVCERERERERESV
jgi:hypothetical protein